MLSKAGIVQSIQNGTVNKKPRVRYKQSQAAQPNKCSDQERLSSLTKLKFEFESNLPSKLSQKDFKTDVQKIASTIDRLNIVLKNKNLFSSRDLSLLDTGLNSLKELYEKYQRSAYLSLVLGIFHLKLNLRVTAMDYFKNAKETDDTAAETLIQIAKTYIKESKICPTKKTKKNAQNKSTRLLQEAKELTDNADDTERINTHKLEIILPHTLTYLSATKSQSLDFRYQTLRTDSTLDISQVKMSASFTHLSSYDELKYKFEKSCPSTISDEEFTQDTRQISSNIDKLNTFLKQKYPSTPEEFALLNTHLKNLHKISKKHQNPAYLSLVIGIFHLKLDLRVTAMAYFKKAIKADEFATEALIQMAVTYIKEARICPTESTKKTPLREAYLLLQKAKELTKNDYDLEIIKTLEIEARCQRLGTIDIKKI
jgi:hypothetical protein